MNSETRGFSIRLRNLHQLISGFDGTVPLAWYLRKAFHAHRNFGSTDRKFYTSWCYSWFRLGHALPELERDRRLAVSWYLVHGPGDPFFGLLAKHAGLELPESLHQSGVPGRVACVQTLFPRFRVEQITGLEVSLSGGLNQEGFAMSMLSQPAVWIRIGSGKEQLVRKALESADVPYAADEKIPAALRLEPQVKLDSLPAEVRRFIQVQDRSSQLAGAVVPARPGERWWDCCCGSGGKTLQLLDRFPDLHIDATDARASVMENFNERLQMAGKRVANWAVTDLNDASAIPFAKGTFDGILADVPCSGSGTWSRTPEQVSFFDSGALDTWCGKQRRIISNILDFLKPGGRLAYITCSVFTRENEDMAQFIGQECPVRIDAIGFLDGIKYRSDSMFYALFTKLG